MIINGILDNNVVQINIFGVEWIEVLKGLQVILVGNGVLGGGVNVVLKKFMVELVCDLMVQYGMNSDCIVVGDLVGVFFDDKWFMYCLIGLMVCVGMMDVGYNGCSDDVLMFQFWWKDSSMDLIVGVIYYDQYLLLL